MKVLQILEKYTENNTALLRSLADPYFDWYGVTFLVPQWLAREGSSWGEMFGEEFDEDDHDGIAEAIGKLSKGQQDDFKEFALDWLNRNAPEDVPSNQHMELSSKKLLSRRTMLVHFSNNADDIWRQGFKYGFPDPDRLGLTTHFGDKVRMREPGWNFAFEAMGSDVTRAAREKKYGNDAVIFWNSGVKVYHWGDAEHQVIFWGTDVEPREIIFLKRDGSEFMIQGNRKWRSKDNREYVFKGDIDDCIGWIEKNWATYKNILGGGR